MIQSNPPMESMYMIHPMNSTLRIGTSKVRSNLLLLLFITFFLIIIIISSNNTATADTTIDTSVSHQARQITYDGNLTIINNGHLLLDRCNITFTGLINIKNGGSFVIRNSTLHINRQNSIYVLKVEEKGRFEIFDSNVISDYQYHVSYYFDFFSNDVRIENTSFNQKGFVHRFYNIVDLHIKNTTFMSWKGTQFFNCSNIKLTGCHWYSLLGSYWPLHELQYGLTMADTDNVEIIQCYFESIETLALWLNRCDSVIIDELTIINSKSMPYVASGLKLERCSNITLTSSKIASMTGDGITLLNSLDILIEGLEVKLCKVGLRGNHSNLVKVRGNVFSSNEIGIQIEQCQLWTIHFNNFYWNKNDTLDNAPRRWDHDGYGNYWHKYKGTDLDGDGIGDEPHHVEKSSEDRNPLMTPWNFTTFRLLATYPADGDDGVPLDIVVSITFSCPIRLSTLVRAIVSVPEIELSVLSTSGMNETWHVTLAIAGPLTEETTYSITVNSTIRDIFNRSLSIPYSSEFSTRDNTLPIIKLVSPVNGSWLSPGVVVTLQVHDSNPGFLIISTEAWKIKYFEQVVALSTGNWSDGEIHLDVIAVDRAGNWGTLDVTFLVDGTPPEVLSIEPPPGSYLNSGMIIEILIRDISTVDVSIDIDGPYLNTTMNTVRIDTTSWREGINEINIHLKDAAGNLANENFIFKIDDTKPEILLFNPEDGSLIGQGAIATFKVYETALEHVATKIGSGSWSQVEDWNDGTIDVDLIVDAEGLLPLYISATDKAGNKAVGSFAFLVDMEPPEISTSPDIVDMYFNRTSVLTVSAVDQSLQTISISIDNEFHYIGTSATVVIDFVALRDGWHDFEIVAIDALNQRTVLSGKFNLDGNAPEIIVIEPTTGYVYSINDIVDVTVLDANLDWYFIILDGEKIFEGNLSKKSFDLKGRSDDEYEIKVVASDKANNEAQMNVTIKVDGTPPTIVPLNFANGSIFKTETSLVVVISDSHEFTPSVRMDGGGWVPLLGTSEFIIPYQMTPGLHTIDIMAVDLVNNTAHASYQVEFDLNDDDGDTNWIWLIIVVIILVSVWFGIFFLLIRPRYFKRESRT